MEKIHEINKLLIQKKASMLDALKQMDKYEVKLLIIEENNKLVSLLSIGDIQRAILRNVSLDTSIDKILRKKINICYENESFEIIKEKMLEHKAEFMPIVNEKNEIVNIYFWKDMFGKNEEYRNHLNIPVVIMAGGKGTRLKPLTNVIPKPLVPIGKKTIMEQIIDNFHVIGCDNFYSVVNYKADMIEYYFNNLDKEYSLEYVHEKKFLGTAGGLHLLENELNETFFVSNCDILVKEDYRQIYDAHIQNNNDVTIVVSIKNFSIPYGTIELDKDGMFQHIKEKPEHSYMINTGMYVLEPNVIKKLNDNEFLHITSLIERCHQEGLKVGIFPISEGSWTDMGQWNEYFKIIDKDIL